MYTLYYYPSNASLLPHMMLREIGAPHELVLVDRTRDAHRAPEYMRMNPNGLIPVLLDGDAVLYETAAIALHLTEKHPDAGLAPLPGDRDRPHFLRWMVHLTNTPQAEFQPWFYPHKFVDGEASRPDVRLVGQRRMEANFERIAGLLGEGPYLLGDRFSAADLFLLMLIAGAGRCRARRATSRRCRPWRPGSRHGLPSWRRSRPRASRRRITDNVDSADFPWLHRACSQCRDIGDSKPKRVP